MFPSPVSTAPTVLVFGGTTEGKQVAAWLAGTDYAFWYSTKTAVDTALPPNGRARWGAFSAAELAEFCRARGVQAIVHASHPFAEQLHATVAAVSEQLGLAVGRVEREYPARLAHPLVHYADSYEEVAAHLHAAGYEPALALSGVQTLPRLRAYWQQHQLLARVLPRPASVARAEAAGFPVGNLILAGPGPELADEVALLMRTGARAVLTKESGESGFLSVKVAAAIAAGVPIFIVRRPVLPVGFRPLATQAELRAFLLDACTHGLTADS